MIKFLKVFSILLVVITLISILILYLYLTQDISTDLKKNRKVTQIEKRSLLIGDDNTSELILAYREDGKLTVYEYKKIMESHKKFVLGEDYEEAIVRRVQREKDYMKNRELYLENSKANN